MSAHARFTERIYGVREEGRPDGSRYITEVFIDMRDPTVKDGVRVYWGEVISDPDEHPLRIISLIDRRAEFPQVEVPDTWP